MVIIFDQFGPTHECIKKKKKGKGCACIKSWVMLGLQIRVLVFCWNAAMPLQGQVYNNFLLIRKDMGIGYKLGEKSGVDHYFQQLQNM